MNVDEEQISECKWDNASLEKMRRELDSALMVKLIPEKFHHGIHRLLVFLSEYENGVYIDEFIDLTSVFREVMNWPDPNHYSLAEAMGCIGMGSEFEVFSIQRDDETGDIHMALLHRHAVSFLMSVVCDYELGLRVLDTLETYHYDQLSDGKVQGIYGPWRSVVRLMLESAIPDGDVPLTYEAVLMRFSNALVESGDADMISAFGDHDGFAKALNGMVSIGLVKQYSGKVKVSPDVAKVFLANDTDLPLLEKLSLQG